MKKYIYPAALIVFATALPGSDVAAVTAITNPKNTWGYDLMNKRERLRHERQVRDLKTEPECRAYIEKHNAEMKRRANGLAVERGIHVELRQTRQDVCHLLKTKNRIK